MSKKRIISSTVIGNIVEYYDFGIYAVFAEIIARLFFPNFDSYTQLMFSFAIFAIGFFMRPIGGIVFGHIGDKMGRKVALTLSIICMSVSTLSIAVLPSYAQIGIAAPILLTVIRMCQGMFIGGEGAGSAIFILEHFGDKKIGLIGSVIMASNITGTLLAIFVGITINHFTTINDFTWRYGFFLGGAIGFVGLLIRCKTNETPVFENMKANKAIAKFPIKTVLQEKWRSILVVASLASIATASTYMIRGFFYVYFVEVLNFSKNSALYIVSFALIVLVLSLPLFGCLSDRVGYKKYIHYIACIVILSVFPIFNVIVNSLDSLSNILCSVAALSVLAAAIAAPYYPFAIKFFTPELRYSGIALGWNLGNAFFGGTTPVIATFLVMHFGDVAPAYYLMFVASMFLVVSLLNRKFLAMH
jgi:MHS family proline/betaine transporter-like MFS transporter